MTDDEKDDIYLELDRLEFVLNAVLREALERDLKDVVTGLGIADGIIGELKRKLSV